MPNVIAVPARLPTKGTISSTPHNTAKKTAFLTPTIEKPIPYNTHRLTIISDKPVRYFWVTRCESCSIFFA